MKLFTCYGDRGRSISLFILLTLLFIAGPFGSNIYAKSGASRLTDQMKTQFDQAIKNGNVNKAKEIWSSIDNAFSDKFDRKMAKTVIFSLGSVASETLQKLHAGKSPEFEHMAQFLSSVNQSFMNGTQSEAIGNLTGTIKDRATRKKLSGVKVLFAGQETLTNSKGEYAFRGIPVGNYNLYWFSSGSNVGENPSVMVEENTSTKYSLTLVMKDGPSVAELKKRHDEALAKTIKEANEEMSTALASRKLKVAKEILVGTLLDENSGMPITKATVIMTCEPNANPSQPKASVGVMVNNVKSDEKGRFTIPEIPEGICDISIMKTNVNFANLLDKIDSHQDRTYGYTQKFRMTANAQHKHEHTWKIAAKTLDTGGTLTGVVLNTLDQTPVVGALVTVANRFIGLVAVDGKTAKTNEQGRFEIRFIPAGDQIIEVTKEVFKRSTHEVKILSAKGVDVALKLDPITTGTVTGLALNSADQKPLASVKITLGTLSTMTNAEGRFEFHEVDAGNVTVQGIKEIFKPATKGLQVLAAKSVDVTLKLAPITRGSVTGIALNAMTHQPLSGVNITLGTLSATTDTQGRFKLEDVLAGDVKVEGSKAIFKSAAQAVKVLAAKRVEVTLNLQPITTGTVTGLALNAVDQKPLAGVKITLGTLSTMTNAQGKFELQEVGVGDATVQGVKEIFRPATKGLQVLAAKSVDVTLKLTPITRGTVTGVALNAMTQQPLSGVNITLGTLSATTDTQGRFKLEDVLAGDVKVEGSKEIFKSAAQAVKVLAAKRVQVTLNLQPITTGTVSGLALNAANQKPLAGVKITLGTLSTVTNAQGKFELHKVGAGDVSVQGNKEIFKPATKGLQVLAAKSVDVTLKLTPITRGTITGVAFNAMSHQPLSGVNITLGSLSATTDSQGRFKLENVLAGDVKVEGSKEIFKPAAQGVKVLAAKRVKVTLSLQPITTGTVTGLALNAANQKPLAGVKITLGTLSTTTDESGQFKLLNVHEGVTLVRGNKAVFKSDSQSAKVQAAKSVKVILKLEPITVGTLTGLALNAVDKKPLSGVTITAGSKSVTTDALGKFTLSKMTAGSLSVQASKQIFKPESADVIVIAAQSVSVTLKLEPITTGTVTGMALNAADKKPLAGVNVTLGTLSAMTNAKGKFKLLNVQAGASLVSGNKAVFMSASTNVKVQAAKSVDVVLILVPITTATIKGLAVDKQTGKPIAGVRVAASNKDDETDGKGVFALINVLAAKTSLVARHADYKTFELPITLKAGEVYNKKLELERRREDVLELGAALREKGTVDLYGIHFDSGKNQFLPSSLSTLQAVSEVIKGMPDNVFEVFGHTDSDGQDDYNQGLSEHRSETVIKWLIGHGVNSKQLKPKGYGESKPVVSNDSEAGEASKPSRAVEGD